MRVLIFLVDAVVSFFCTLFLLRFLMQVTRVSFAGQFGDFVVKLTNWAVKPAAWTGPALSRHLPCKFCYQRWWSALPARSWRPMVARWR